MRSGGAGKVTQNWSYSRWLVFYTLLDRRYHMTLRGTAVTAGNIVFEIDTSQDALNSDFAKLPPCKIETNIAIDGVDYPIVRSHPVPCGVEWNDSWDHINRCLIILINLGHGMLLPIGILVVLLTVRCGQLSQPKKRKAHRLGRNLGWRNTFVHLKLSLVCLILQRWMFGCLVAP